MSNRRVRIGEGAGYAGAWVEPAIELVERGNLNYLCLEGLAERTIAIAQFERERDPNAGFSPFFERRMRALLPAAIRTGTKIVTNMGAANPLGAARRVVEIASELGVTNVRVAAVVGDDVRDLIASGEWTCLETGRPMREHAPTMLSANAYIGAEPLALALRRGADVVIAGRAGDAALHLACLEHAWNWAPDDYARVAAGTLVGHLLECSTQITGGYFADPARTPVRGLGHCGYPIAEVDDDGSCVITKIENSGGSVTERTCKEQVLYEVHDPAAYITPDVIADFSNVRVRELGPDRVQVAGANGKDRPAAFKAIAGVRSGFIAEGQLSYGGRGAVGRARLAADIVRERLDTVGIVRQEERADIVGFNSLYGDLPGVDEDRIPEARMRYAARVATREEAQAIADDIEALWIAGPSGGGGATKAMREVVITLSTLIPRELVERQIEVVQLW